MKEAQTFIELTIFLKKLLVSKWLCGVKSIRISYQNYKCVQGDFTQSASAFTVNLQGSLLTDDLYSGA